MGGLAGGSGKVGEGIGVAMGMWPGPTGVGLGGVEELDGEDDAEDEGKTGGGIGVAMGM